MASTEELVAKALLPILDQIRPAVSEAAGVRLPGDKGVRVGADSEAFGDGVAIGPRIRAGAGCIHIDIQWLRLLAKE